MTAPLLDLLTMARFDALIADAVDGAPLLLRARHADTLSRLVARAEAEPMMLQISEAAPGPGRPADLLLAAGNVLGAGADDLQGLIASPALHYALLVGRAGRDELGAWATVAGVFASLRAAHGPTGPALVIVTQSPHRPAGCRFFDDGHLFGPAESALLARLHRPEASLLAQAADAAAVETARGDPVLLERLLALGDAERLDPTGWILRQPTTGQAASLPWRGLEAPCPIWLARHDPAALRRRVWRGHLGVLLPWLEEARADFLARAASVLPTGLKDATSGDAIEPVDYEWGNIVGALRWLRDGDAAAAADTLRRVRNALAHAQPAPLDDCRRMEPALRRLLAWR